MEEFKILAESFQLADMRTLINAIYEKYGYDFRSYTEAALMRRMKAVAVRLGCSSFPELKERLLSNPEFFAVALPDFTVTTSEMFRDPGFYQSVRENVIPMLRTFPSFKIWHAGCSTGEEVYSFAIMLKEEGLYDRAVIYATDINSRALKTAREGIYNIASIQNYTTNYQRAGGKESFSSYYQAAYGCVSFDKSLRENVTFADHNLVTDNVFSEMNLIICRNVLIYFDKTLQNRVLKLFYDSLRYKGFLCLGTKETVRFLEYGDRFGEIDGKQRIFQKSVPR